MFEYDELVLISECLDLLRNEYGVEVNMRGGNSISIQDIIEKIDNIIDETDSKLYS